jgi:carbon starvation protein CstA
MVCKDNKFQCTFAIARSGLVLKNNIMISFIACFTVLIAGYFLYGSYVDKIFKPEKSHITPAFKQQDGMDYVPLPS